MKELDLVINMFNNASIAIDSIDNYQNYCSMVGVEMYFQDRIDILKSFANERGFKLTDKQFYKIDFELRKIIK